jgi:hypothetical protein
MSEDRMVESSFLKGLKNGKTIVNRIQMSILRTVDFVVKQEEAMWYRD